MGIGGISMWQLLIILVIVVMLFGTKRLRGLGSDLGSAIKGFKKSMSDEDSEAKTDEDDPAKQVEDKAKPTSAEKTRADAEKASEKK